MLMKAAIGKHATKSFHRGLAALAFFFAANAPCMAIPYVFVSNWGNNTIEKYSLSGTDLGAFASTGLNQPVGLAFDSSGNLYAANWGNNTIEKYSSSGTDLGAFASTGLNRPSYIAISGLGGSGGSGGGGGAGGGSVSDVGLTILLLGMSLTSLGWMRRTMSE